MKNLNNVASRSVSAILAVLILTILLGSAARSQTSAFTYQGRFNDSSAAQPTNGNYNMTFRLFNAASGGNQIPNNTTEIASLVSVTNGVFTARLDFGAAAFMTTQPRYLEVQVGSTVLTPRQEIASTPFAIRATNAAAADSLSSVCVGCVTNAQISSLAGSKITGTVASATSATTAANFSGSLSGDVGGTQSATVIQPDSITAGKIASNQVVKSINGLKDLIALTAGSGITLTPNGNTLNLSLTNIPLRRYVVGGLVGGYQYSVPHNLNTSDIIVQVYGQDGHQLTIGNADASKVNGYVKVVDANTVLVGIYPAGTFRVTVIG